MTIRAHWITICPTLSQVFWAPFFQPNHVAIPDSNRPRRMDMFRTSEPILSQCVIHTMGMHLSSVLLSQPTHLELWGSISASFFYLAPPFSRCSGFDYTRYACWGCVLIVEGLAVSRVVSS